MLGRFNKDSIHLLRGLMDKCRKSKEDLHMIFVNIEKAYDKDTRKVLWRNLEKKGVNFAYIHVVV